MKVIIIMTSNKVIYELEFGQQVTKVSQVQS